MAKTTLDFGNYPADIHREIFSYNRHKSYIYYEELMKTEAVAVVPKKEKKPAAAPPAPPKLVTPPPVAAPAVVAVAAPVAAPSGPAVDRPPSALEFLQILFSVKLKKEISAFPPTVIPKTVMGGNSAQQNEIAGDIEAEFQDKAGNLTEQTLQQIADAVKDKYAKSGPGKISSGIIAKMVSRAIPGDFGGISAAVAYLGSAHGISPRTAQTVLLFAATQEPKVFSLKKSRKSLLTICRSVWLMLKPPKHG